MEKELLEQMAEKVHNSWWEEKKNQEFHHPQDCLDTHKTKDDFVMCSRCHSDMKPYQELREEIKELDRVMVRQFEEHLEELGYAIGIDATK